MKQLTLSCLVILCIFGCTKETINDQQPVDLKKPSLELEQYKAPYEIGEVQLRSSCMWIEIAAGSNNALTEAIANSCEGGIIYLKAGEHSQSGMLTIDKSVKIIGEAGAVLKLASQLTEEDENGATTSPPEIHIINAPGTLIQDVSIQPIEGDGGLAILVENSPYSAVMRTEMNDFQYAVLVQKSDYFTAMLNKIVMTSAWLTGETGSALGITIMNGKSAYIADNEVSNSVFAIWACDQWGTLERNNTYGSYLGIILCNVPPSFVLPSGDLVGSETPANQWKVRNNTSHDNFTTGYLVIDGANNNLLENNAAENNGTYDIEITTDSERFGFLTPAGYSNTVNVGSYTDLTIKNCGPDNTINGGVLIDNSADPCN